jgi:alginate O-acetyltransferase complex protein AlgI
MVFSSSLFLCFFLPVFFGIYFIADKKFKNTILVLGSCIFYAWGAPKFIFVILGTTLLDYFLVKRMHQIGQNKKRLI